MPASQNAPQSRKIVSWPFCQKWFQILIFVSTIQSILYKKYTKHKSPKVPPRSGPKLGTRNRNVETNIDYLPTLPKNSAYLPTFVSWNQNTLGKKYSIYMTPPPRPQIRSQIADLIAECRDKSYSHLSLEIKTHLVKNTVYTWLPDLLPTRAPQKRQKRRAKSFPPFLPSCPHLSLTFFLTLTFTPFSVSLSPPLLSLLHHSYISYISYI